MKTLVSGALALAFIGYAGIAHAATAAELAAQAELLLQQVTALQAQLQAQGGTTGTQTGGAAICPNIGRVLKYGSTGDDVTRLQRFLAADPSIYPEAMITGYYGALTESAVKRWQTKFNIVSSGDPASTGFGVAGPRTAAAIALQCSGGTNASNPANTGTPTVGGFIQVSPVSGNAPLTARVTATVNTVNSCAAASYTLDWGDGTIPQSIQVPAGQCAPLQQIYSHIYIYGGTYIVRLSAGEHSTMATVIVSGAAAPSQNTNPTVISVSSPTSGQSYAHGSSVPVVWTAGGTIPANSRVVLDLYTAAGSKVGNSLDSTSSLSGTYQWQVPSTLAPATYKIRATLTSNSQAVVWGESGVFTVSTSASTYNYGPLAVTPLVSNDPLKVSVSFDIPNSCTGYSLSWGDGSANAAQSHSTGCANSAVTRIFTHTYAGSGTYTITLKRGETLSHVDTASVVIAN